MQCSFHIWTLSPNWTVIIIINIIIFSGKPLSKILFSFSFFFLLWSVMHVENFHTWLRWNWMTVLDDDLLICISLKWWILDSIWRICFACFCLNLISTNLRRTDIFFRGHKPTDRFSRKMFLPWKKCNAYFDEVCDVSDSYFHFCWWLMGLL